MIAGIENHHSGNCRISASAHFSFCCSRAMSRCVPVSYACFESREGSKRAPDALGHVVGVERGLPVHRIQIGHLHRMAGGLEMLDREVAQRTVQRARFGMGIDDQHVHVRDSVD
jgi:hypothetical protein